MMRDVLVLLPCLALFGAGCGNADPGAGEGSADGAGVTTRVDTSGEGTVHVRNSGAPPAGVCGSRRRSARWAGWARPPRRSSAG